MHYVVMIHKDYMDAVRKFIADEALPVEIYPDDSKHVEIYTWIKERRTELRALFLHTDFYAMQRKLDNKPDERFVQEYGVTFKTRYDVV